MSCISGNCGIDIKPKYFTAPKRSCGPIVAGQVNVIDNLDSTRTDDALSANQGRLINEKVDKNHEEINERLDLEITIINNRITNEVTNINNRIDQEITTINNRITNEINRIDGDISDIRELIVNIDNRITNEITRIDGRIDETNQNLADLEIDINNKLDGKVDKVPGYGLSQNDFTDEYRNKLDQVEDGAEVNQNAFSFVSNGVTTASATEKTDTLQVRSAGATSISITDKTMTVSSVNTTYGEATQSSSGLMSAADKAKLDNVLAGAQVNQNLIAGSNISLSVSGNDVTISSGGAESLAVFTREANGVVPAPGGDTDTRYLREDGVWETPAGGGGGGGGASITNASITIDPASFVLQGDGSYMATISNAAITDNSFVTAFPTNGTEQYLRFAAPYSDLNAVVGAFYLKVNSQPTSSVALKYTIIA